MLSGLCAQLGAVVRLRDFIDGEVLRVNIGLQLRFKRRVDAAQTVPLHASEEGVRLDLMSTTEATKPVFRIANQTNYVSFARKNWVIRYRRTKSSALGFNGWSGGK